MTPGVPQIEESAAEFVRVSTHTHDPLPAHDPLIGTVLADRYEILRRIGEGGMGAVYEARHTVLGKRVAVKVLLEKFLDKTDLGARLLQEARLAGSIGHENIVDVADFGRVADGRAFIVMELLEGESLADLIFRDAPLSVERSLRIVRQVASALGAAHAQGIIHRDVKPQNVFLVRRNGLDFVKVVDFGVSKAMATREDGFEHQRLTRTGTILGTPLYMSPEQARGGDDVDGRADVWAVGVMLYECLTGEVPFRANNYLGVIAQVTTQEVVPPTQLRPELGIPPAVEAVILRALDKDRQRRYQTMGVFQRDLERLLAGESDVGGLKTEVAPAVAPPGRSGIRWHLGVAAVLAVGVGIAAALAQTDATPRQRRTRATVVIRPVDSPANTAVENRPAGNPAVAAPVLPTALPPAAQAKVPRRARAPVQSGGHQRGFKAAGADQLIPAR
jgi:serine/threonine-protein kinase